MNEELKTAIFEALGEASMCWSEIPSGIFESTNAKRIGDELWSKIEQKIKEARINELKTIKSLVDHNILYINNEGKFIGG